MIIKVFEVRDRATCVIMMGTKLGSHAQNDESKTHEEWCFYRAGFDRGHRQHNYILLTNITGGEPYESHTDPFNWSNSRTYRTVHMWLQEHFDEVDSGQVIDVEHILGETAQPKQSELYA